MKCIAVEVEVRQVTRGGELLTRRHRRDAPALYRGPATFSRSRALCRFRGAEYRKIPAGGWGGGNYADAAGNTYSVVRVRGGA